MSNFNFVTDARLAKGTYTSNNTTNTATIDGWMFEVAIPWGIWVANGGF
jgi:hypothetical protein